MRYGHDNKKQDELPNAELIRRFALKVYEIVECGSQADVVMLLNGKKHRRTFPLDRLERIAVAWEDGTPVPIGAAFVGADLAYEVYREKGRIFSVMRYAGKPLKKPPEEEPDLSVFEGFQFEPTPEFIEKYGRKR